MSLHKTFLTAGVIWAPPLAFAAAAATLATFLWAGQFIGGFHGFALIAAALATLTAFAGSIMAANRYGERLARKLLGAWAGKLGASLICLGILANVALVVGFVGLVAPHDDEIVLKIIMEEEARESVRE